MIADTEALIRGKYDSLTPAFNEAELRLWAAAEARSLGHGGVSTVARATGLSRNTVMAGLREAVPDLPAKPDAETVFRTLRELRNKW